MMFEHDVFGTGELDDELEKFVEPVADDINPYCAARDPWLDAFDDEEIPLTDDDFWIDRDGEE